MKKIIAFKDVILDKQFQSRAKGIDVGHVADLMLTYDGPEAAFVDPPRVFEIMGRSGYWLTRGFHRIEALSRAGKTRFEFEVRSGNLADAILDAATSNVGHGLKMTAADKRRCVKLVIEGMSGMSDRVIAEKCGVSHSMVADVRGELEETPIESGESPDKSRSRIGRNGKPYPVVRKKSPVDPKAKIYEKDDGVPDLPGVYTPRFMKTEAGHEVVLDAHDNPAPDRVGDIFADPVIRMRLAEATEASESFETLNQAVMKMTRSPNFPFVDIPKLQLLAKRMRDLMVEMTDHLREAVPTLVCPKCAGAGGKCQPCRMSGYLSKGVYDLHPEYHARKRAV